MKVTKLELKNWGPHEKKSYTFHGGLIGIVGKNGAGKSNLLQAINYALTGDLNKQKQSRYIRNYGEPDGAKSASVRLDFVCHGEPVSIRRTITETGSKREFSRGDVVIRKSSELEAAVQTMFGVDIESLEQAVFLKQGELARLVKGTPSERFSIFQKLVNLNFLEKRINDLPSIISALQGEYEDLTPSIVNVQQTLAALNAELDNVDEVVDRYNTANELITEFSSYRQLAYKFTQATKTVAAYQEQEQDLNTHIRELQETVRQACQECGVSTLSELQKLMEIKNTSYDLLAEHKKRYEAYCGTKKQYDEANQKLASVHSEVHEFIKCYGNMSTMKEREETLKHIMETWNSLQETEKEQKAYEAEDKEIRNLLQGYRREREKAQEECDKEKQELPQVVYDYHKAEIAIRSADFVIDAYKQGAPCPCCGAPLTQEAVDKVTLEKVANEQRFKELASRKAALEHSSSALKVQKAQYNINVNTIREEAITSKLQKLMERKKTSKDYLASCEVSSITEEQIAQLANDLSQLSSLQNQYNTLSLKVSILEQEKSKLLTSISIEPPEIVNDADYTAAKEELLYLNERYAKARSEQELVDKFQAEKETISASLKTVTAEIYELEEKLIEQETLFESMINDASAASKFCIPSPSSFSNEDEQEEFLRENFKAATELKHCKDVALGQKQHYEAHLASLQEQQAQHDKQISCAKALSRVKDVIGKKGVLLAYMTDVFNKITAVVQDLLSQLGANFVVRPDPDNACSYLFTRTDTATAVELPQEMLSGGQAIRLALAMLLACQRVILPDVGLLVLDEPTSHIDAGGVASMRNMFLKMNELLCNSEMTVILVDHNTELMESIPNIIKL